MDYVVLIKADNRIYLMMDRKTNAIHGFRSAVDGVRYFEDGYRASHQRGYESSMSAAINWMQFQPSIVGFNTIEELADALKITPDSDVKRLGSVAGMMRVVDVDQAEAERRWEQGDKPRLV